MKNILICNSKGGVGKSLIADELAFYLEHQNITYNFYDLDNQGGTVHKNSKSDNALISVIDTPGALQEQLAQWIKSAHLIIVPTRTTSRDIEPLRRMIDIIKINNSVCPVIYVLNAFNRWKASSDFFEWLSNQVQGNIIKLPQSELFVQASAYNKSILDFAPRSKPALAVLELGNLVCNILQI